MSEVARWVSRIERKAHGQVARDELLWKQKDQGFWRTLVTGRWLFTWAILILAAGNVLTLAIGGAPWSITFAFNVWGAKALQAIGVDMGQFEFWQWEYPAMALKDSLLTNIPSVMNFGLLLGAMLAAGLANRFNEASRNKLQGRPFLAAVVGGLLLGYGARLGFGCNIGALFSGIGSASLHAWIWFACRTDNGSTCMNPAYRKGRVLALLGAILILIVIDHLNSPTFAFNSGQGNVQTALSQKDESACAPCPSTRD